jgi:hypothetical protein
MRGILVTLARCTLLAIAHYDIALYYCSHNKMLKIYIKKMPKIWGKMTVWFCPNFLAKPFLLNHNVFTTVL